MKRLEGIRLPVKWLEGIEHEAVDARLRRSAFVTGELPIPWNAAPGGGVTSLLDMPNTAPPPTTTDEALGPARGEGTPRSDDDPTGFSGEDTPDETRADRYNGM